MGCDFGKTCLGCQFRNKSLTNIFDNIEDTTFPLKSNPIVTNGTYFSVECNDNYKMVFGGFIVDNGIEIICVENNFFIKELFEAEFGQKLNSQNEENSFFSVNNNQRINSQEENHRINSQEEKQRINSQEENHRINNQEEKQRINSQEENKKIKCVEKINFCVLPIQREVFYIKEMTFLAKIMKNDSIKISTEKVLQLVCIKNENFIRFNCDLETGKLKYENSENRQNKNFINKTLDLEGVISFCNLDKSNKSNKSNESNKKSRKMVLNSSKLFGILLIGEMSVGLTLICLFIID